MFRNAITRTPGADFAQGLTTSSLGAPDIELARAQHTKYIQTLSDLGLEVEVLPELPGFPDATFVEDTAIVVPEAAVITNPGALSRRGETSTVEVALKKYKPTVRITAEGATIDGGDIMLIGNTFYVGMSERTNQKGLEALYDCLKPYGGYRCIAVEVPAGLHLKSSVTHIADNTIIVAENLAEDKAFRDYKKVVLPMEMDYAANTLLINGTVIMTSGFPNAVKMVENAGCKVIALEMTEYRKMDGALTCLSLRF